MKIAYIASYPPRQCGIGTFTNNLIKSVEFNLPQKTKSNSTMVIAMNDGNRPYIYPPEVKYEIPQNDPLEYLTAAKIINEQADMCVLQHEFGIFGGDDGVFILPLLHRLKVPLVVTFHTVLKNPTFTQKSITKAIAREANYIVVMSKLAVQFLEEIYSIPSDKIKLIEHGVPVSTEKTRSDIRKGFGFNGHKVLFTFGLLSRNKGLETTINALPEIVKNYPDTIYYILGKTHPNVVQENGEEYRNYLKLLAKKLGVSKNIVFDDRFLSEKELFEILSAIDVYLTPYLHEAQITSGTLSYAIGAGAAVVSTPYWHAKELLDEGRGHLFPFKDADALQDCILKLFNNPELLENTKEKAWTYGNKLRWPQIGRDYLDLFETLKRREKKKIPIEEYQPIDLSLLPDFNMNHMLLMTDDTGIIQHAKYGIPNLKEGYCLDDNCRALLMALMAERFNKGRIIVRKIPVFLSYIHYMQNENGSFRNFLSFDRKFLDECGSEDAFGRTIWSLGYLMRFSPGNAYLQLGKDLFFRSVDYFDQLKFIRGMANSVIGIAYYLKDNSGDEVMIGKLKKMADKIVDSFKKNSDEDWHWFEDEMTYDNAILPLALLHAYEVTDQAVYYEVAMKATLQIEKYCRQYDFFSPVGNRGWLSRGEEMPVYDQQALEVMAMVLLYYQLYQISKEKVYIDKLFNAYLWFLGENSLRLPLYNHETGGCCDGLESTGVNQNQGAESTLAYWVSHLTVLAVYHLEHEYLH